MLEPLDTTLSLNIIFIFYFLLLIIMDIVHRKCSFLIAFGYFLMSIPASSMIAQTNFCTVPPQPENGYRLLYMLDCPSQISDCDVQEGTKLPIWSILIYTCNPGYQINGSGHVVCDREGNWSDFPVCTEIRCKSLASASRNAYCKLNDQQVSCKPSVLPGTIAQLSCRPGYTEVVNFESELGDQVVCDNTGQWKPEPILCYSNESFDFRNLTFLSVDIKKGFFSYIPKYSPGWHATLYYQKASNESKKFICGATIIKEKFLLTAAHCIYDETYRTIQDPNKYYVATGNIYRDYDYKWHNEEFVKKARVKGIYVPCNYVGFEGNYVNDIAILEIESPFVLSRSLILAGLNGDLIESGLGLVSGFGRTTEGSSSFIIQSAFLPYVPLDQCKSSTNFTNSENLKTMDKFCAGYTNGTSVCDGDSGGGFMTKTGDLWFLRGITSLSVDNTLMGGTTICGTHSYSLYTRISTHINWIEDIISRLETSQPLPTCGNSTVPSTTSTSPLEFISNSTSTTTSSPSIQNTTVCTVPPDPANGHRLLHKSYCQTQEDCAVEEGVELVSGSHLIYTCNQGYELSGISDVICSPEGEWINIPVCTAKV